MDPKAAEKLFELIDKFGGYGFNKSHSAAYALIAYQTAYLKAHYPVQFMAALLTQDMGNQDKTIKNIAECREMGHPDPSSGHQREPVRFFRGGGSDPLRPGAVKNVGLKAVESMIEERNRGRPLQGPGGLLHEGRRVQGQPEGAGRPHPVRGL